MFFILLTIYLLNKEQELLSILSFSFAILTKTWPILFIIPILKNIKNKKLIILIVFFPVLFTTLYCINFNASPIDIGKTLIGYQGLWGIWGPWILLGKQRILFQKLSTLIFLIGFFGYSYFNKEKNLIKNILQLLFFFFVFTTNFSIQYFVWIVPFIYFIRPKKYLWLILLISLYLFSFYYLWLFNLSLTNIQNIIGFILWLFFIKVGYLSSK